MGALKRPDVKRNGVIGVAVKREGTSKARVSLHMNLPRPSNSTGTGWKLMCEDSRIFIASSERLSLLMT